MPESTSTEAPAAKPRIPFEDFIKLDLRVATVTAVELHPDADRLLKVQLDDGTESGRQVCAGIKAWYTPEDLLGKQVIIVANLEPRKIRGEMSEGRILAATEAGDGGEKNVFVLSVDKPVPAGAPVS
jgi:methionine--tRNA ligase beta chain